jgi:hypothetical protein
VVGETIEEQTRHTIGQLKIYLPEVGASIKDVVSLCTSPSLHSKNLAFCSLSAVIFRGGVLSAVKTLSARDYSFLRLTGLCDMVSS